MIYAVMQTPDQGCGCGFITFLRPYNIRNTHHPQQAIAINDLNRRPHTTPTQITHATPCWYHWATGISVRIGALATALPPALHDYQLSMTNQIIRSFRTCFLTAAEGGKARTARVDRKPCRRASTIICGWTPHLVLATGNDARH